MNMYSLCARGGYTSPHNPLLVRLFEKSRLGAAGQPYIGVYYGV